MAKNVKVKERKLGRERAYGLYHEDGLIEIDPRIPPKDLCPLSEASPAAFDSARKAASSALSASSIRQQFSSAINIALSRWSVEFLRRVADELEVGGDRPAIGLVERLDDRFHLLTTGSRTAVPRQQTLRGTIDWSYNLPGLIQQVEDAGYTVERSQVR